jgi:hypothetical protein
MADEEEGVMDGPAWPPEWQVGYATFKYSDITGASPIGDVRISSNTLRAVARISNTTVHGGFIDVPIANGAPSGPRVYENSQGIMCVKFPIGNDPDVVPSGMQLLAREPFSGVTIRKNLTAEHTLENPLWLTDDLESVLEQPGVVQRLTYWVDLEASGVPAGAQVGDAIVYLDTRKMFVIESL